MAIMRGTTPTVTFRCPFSVSAVTALNISFVQYPTGYPKTVLEKKLSEVTISGTDISIHLTQVETLSFSVRPMKIQIRMILDGEAIGCDPIVTNVKRILKDGVLS